MSNSPEENRLFCKIIREGIHASNIRTNKLVLGNSSLFLWKKLDKEEFWLIPIDILKTEKNNLLNPVLIFIIVTNNSNNSSIGPFKSSLRIDNFGKRLKNNINSANENGKFKKM